MGTGLLRPKNKILGADVAGRVEAVGNKVKQLQPGDEVFGDTSGNGEGGFAEYARVREAVLALQPANLSFEKAAAIPLAAVTALQGPRGRSKIKSGQSVLVHGAAGSVDTLAVSSSLQWRSNRIDDLCLRIKSSRLHEPSTPAVTGSGQVRVAIERGITLLYE